MFSVDDSLTLCLVELSLGNIFNNTLLQTKIKQQ